MLFEVGKIDQAIWEFFNQGDLAMLYRISLISLFLISMSTFAAEEYETILERRKITLMRNGSYIDVDMSKFKKWDGERVDEITIRETQNIPYLKGLFADDTTEQVIKYLYKETQKKKKEGLFKRMFEKK